MQDTPRPNTDKLMRLLDSQLRVGIRTSRWGQTFGAVDILLPEDAKDTDKLWYQTNTYNVYGRECPADHAHITGYDSTGRLESCGYSATVCQRINARAWT